MTTPPKNYPDRRSHQFRVAQRAREQAESQHDKLCIINTRAYGMESCWCKCRLCWDPVTASCVCIECHCRAENLLPLYPSTYVQKKE